MSELIRDTVLGHLLRYVTGRKVLLYEEEKNPELWKKYVSKEKSANLAVHGETTPPSEEKPEGQGQEASTTRSPSSGSTVVDED